MKKQIEHYLHNQGCYENQFNPPADITKIKEVEKELNFNLPKDYIAFLKITNGFEGNIGKSYCQFFQLEKVLEYTNGYCKEHYPKAIQIGGNGAGEMYVILTREGEAVYGVLPYIGVEEDLIPLGNSFDEFLEHLYLNNFWHKEDNSN